MFRRSYPKLFIGLLAGAVISSWSNTVTVTSPANESNIIAGTTLTLDVSAIADVGTISLVRMVEDGVVKDSSAAATSTFSRTGLNSGSHYYQFIAIDNLGATVTSNTLRIHVQGKMDAFAVNKASRYSQNNGVTPEFQGGNPTLGYINFGDYIGFDSVSFGIDTARNISIRAATVGGGNVEVYQDSLTGTLLGSCIVGPTGGWTTWKTLACGITPVSGVHNIYFKFTGNPTGYLINLDEFSFGKTVKNKPPVISITSPSDNSTITAPATVNVNITATDDGNITKVVLWNNGVLIGEDLTAPYTFNVPVTNSGILKLLAKAMDNDSAVTIATATLTVSGTAITAKYKAINAGGEMFTGADGIVYQADLIGGQVFNSSGSVTGSSDMALYQTERYDGNLEYKIPVANGRHKLILKFAEIFQTQVGARIFDVIAEGDTLIKSLDIYKEVGAFQAYDVVKMVNVLDGELNLKFSGTKENAKVSAIVVMEDSLFQNQPPAAPALTFPAQNAMVTTMLSLKWNHNSLALNYEVQVATDSFFTNGFFSQQTGVVDDFIGLPNLSENLTLYWRVRGFNANGSGEFSEVRTFTIPAVTPILSNSMGNKFSPRLNYSKLAMTMTLPHSGVISLDLYNPKGEKITVYSNKLLNAGEYNLSKKIQNLSRGVWMVNFKINQTSFNQKVFIK